jgi:hypothetical protein
VGRARQLCPGGSDVDFLGDFKRVVDRFCNDRSWSPPTPLILKMLPISAYEIVSRCADPGCGADNVIAQELQ